MHAPVRAQDYFDYRDYLRDVFAQRKAKDPRLSHRQFARQAGLGSPSYFLMVIGRKRNLTPSSARKFADALKLAGRERTYFETLVAYNQADTLDEKSGRFSELLKLRARAKRLHPLERERFEFLSQWHAVAIYVLVGLPSFRDDAAWIAKRLLSRISPAQARDALSLLSRLSLIEKTEGGWKQTHGPISVADDTRAMAVARYHESMIKLAYEALKKTPIDGREMAGATISIPAHRLPELKEKIRSFRKDLNSWASEFADSDRLFQLNVQLFPLSDETPQTSPEEPAADKGSGGAAYSPRSP